MTSSRYDGDEIAYQNAKRFLTAFGALKGYILTQIASESEAGLHTSQLSALHFIFYEPGITQTQLASRLKITTTAVSNAIRDMAVQELVERRPSPDDARSMQLFLAPKGQGIVEDIINKSTQVLVDLLSPLSVEEQQMFIETLEKILLAGQIDLDITKLIYWD